MLVQYLIKTVIPLRCEIKFGNFSFKHIVLYANDLFLIRDKQSRKIEKEGAKTEKHQAGN